MIYEPPLTITAMAINLLADTAEAIGRMSMQWESEQALRLRHIYQCCQSRLNNQKGQYRLKVGFGSSHLILVEAGKKMLKNNRLNVG